MPYFANQYLHFLHVRNGPVHVLWQEWRNGWNDWFPVVSATFKKRKKKINKGKGKASHPSSAEVAALGNSPCNSRALLPRASALPLAREHWADERSIVARAVCGPCVIRCVGRGLWRAWCSVTSLSACFCASAVTSELWEAISGMLRWYAKPRVRRSRFWNGRKWIPSRLHHL